MFEGASIAILNAINKREKKSFLAKAIDNFESAKKITIKWSVQKIRYGPSIIILILASNGMMVIVSEWAVWELAMEIPILFNPGTCLASAVSVMAVLLLTLIAGVVEEKVGSMC